MGYGRWTWRRRWWRTSGSQQPEHDSSGPVVRVCQDSITQTQRLCPQQEKYYSKTYQSLPVTQPQHCCKTLFIKCSKSVLVKIIITDQVSRVTKSIGETSL